MPLLGARIPENRVAIFFCLLQKVQTDISEFQPRGELGHGTCGQVVCMLHRPTNKLLAVKVFIYYWLLVGSTTGC